MGQTFRVELRPEWLIEIALSLLILPLRWIAAVLLAAAVHEACHILAIRLQRVKIYSMDLDFFGAKISTEPMQVNAEFFSAAAGPMGSFLLAGFLEIYPELALCGIVQGLYNLLPVYPSDGWRMVHCFIDIHFSKYAHQIESVIRVISAVMILALGILFLFLFPRCIFFVCITFFFLLKGVIRKIPCKDGAFAVQ